MFWSEPDFPPLGLGTAAIGRPGYLNLGHGADLSGNYEVEAMRQRCHALLDAAWQAGIRYFDTARSYGRAEEFLGRWLRERQPPGARVGSKWGYTYTADWKVEAAQHEVKDHSERTLEKQIQETRANLGDALHLYQIHSVTPDSGVLKNRNVLTALQRLRASGLTLGLSVSGPEQSRLIGEALLLQSDGIRLFDSVQVTYNVLEQSTASALREARSAGLFVIIKEGLANGRLTLRNTISADGPALQAFLALAGKLQTSPDALALAFILQQSVASCVLSGAATLEQLSSNLQSQHLKLNAEVLDLLTGLCQPAAQYWKTRSTMAWQ